MRHATTFACAAVLLAATSAAAQQPTVPVSTATLADLCRATVGSTDDTIALGYCRGFIIGAGQFHNSATGARGMRPLFCLPTQTPTLEAVQAGFVAWAGANPQYGGERAVDGLMRFAAATYPCPPAPARRPAPR